MKALFNSFLLAGALLFVGCAKDNVEPPSSNLTGRVIYQDQPVGVRTNGVQLELWQYGYQLRNKIPVYVAQDGSFSATVFDGNYKLVRLRDNGPWVNNTDSIDVQVRGNAVVDVPVVPYFVFQNASIQRSGATVSATCRVRQLGSRSIERVALLISSTQFVDVTNSIGRTELAGTAVADLNKDLSFSVTVPTTLRGAVYARVGVKATGVAEYLYSPVQKFE